MADKINFSQNINVSVQVGDTLYYTNVTGGAGNPIEIGPITEVGSNQLLQLICFLCLKNQI